MGVWKEIKYAINKTLGTDLFMPLNELTDKIVNDATGRIYTADDVFIVPAGVRAIYVTACGGGGGGGNTWLSGNSPGGGGGGGGADAVYFKKLAVTPGTRISITIGKGGGAVSNGGTTSIGNLLSLAGGQGGGVRYSFAGGTKGGTGGGDGSDATSRSDSLTSADGILGKGGTGYGAKQGAPGGGSLGDGGSRPDSKSPGFGGGGAGADANNSGGVAVAAQTGGNGIVIIAYTLAGAKALYDMTNFNIDL